MLMLASLRSDSGRHDRNTWTISSEYALDTAARLVTVFAICHWTIFRIAAISNCRLTPPLVELWEVCVIISMPGGLTQHLGVRNH